MLSRGPFDSTSQTLQYIFKHHNNQGQDLMYKARLGQGKENK